MTKKNKKLLLIKTAKAISIVFDGSVLATPIFVASSFLNKLSTHSTSNLKSFKEIFISFIIAVIFTALIPYTLILLLYKNGRIKDLQISRRKERLFPLLIVNISVILGYFLFVFSNPEKLLKSVYLIYLFSLPVISLITIFWKISFHASYITLFSIVYIMVFGKWAVFTLPLIPLVGWSRIRLRKHTLAQVIAGFGITLAICLIIFYFFGFLSFSYWAVIDFIDFFKGIYSYLYLIIPSFSISAVIVLVYLFFYLYNKNKNSKEKI